MEFSYFNARLSVAILHRLLAFGYIATLVLPSLTLAADNTLLNELSRLDNEFRNVSAIFYSSTSSNPDQKIPKVKSIKRLLQLVKKSIADADDVSAIRLLHRNKNLVMDNVDSRAVFTFIELLLRNNETKMANRIYDSIRNEGERSLLATANFIFAKYYADRNEWNRTAELLDGIFTELPKTDATYAYLLMGVALQELKKHRQAIIYYKKIPYDSYYYREAQLNIAVANIRQGWWTDANIIIEKVTNKATSSDHDEALNRLHLVLGYALLQREYYRNAREAFRKIALSSRYANRALLGIGLTATSQGDFVGGLNALSILKQKNTFDLSVDESYLLLPYVYDKLQQEITVSASYAEAMNHYKKRIRSLEQLIEKHKDFSASQFDRENSILILNDNSLDYGAIFPNSFLKNYRLLQDLSISQDRQGSISNKLQRLLRKYDSAYQKVANTLLEKRISYLRSYLNQSRYGFARFLDSNSETTTDE
jgi:hypothetical protein